MDEQEMGIEQARARLGDLVNDAATKGRVTYLTSHRRRIASLIPLERARFAMASKYVLAGGGEVNTFVIPVPEGMDVGDVKDLIEEAGMESLGTVYPMAFSKLRGQSGDE